MYQGTGAVTSLPVAGAGTMAYTQGGGVMEVVLLTLVAFTLVAAARTVWRMAPRGGDVR